MRRLMQLIALMTLFMSLATFNGCAKSPIVVIKGIDFDDGIKGNMPSDKTTWMWITYPTAKRQLHWINNK
jgi:hypothetical protein